MSNISVATLNLLHNTDQWHLRLPLIVRELANLQPDVIGLQECLWGPDHVYRVARELNAETGCDGYTVYTASRTGWLRRIEALAILSRLPLVEEDRLPLRSGNRVSQRVRFQLPDGNEFDFVNNHLHHPIDGADLRAKQALKIIRWLSSCTGSVATVIAGDLNGTADEEAVRLLKAQYSSVFESLGCNEPITFGSPLAGHFEQPVPQKTIDYILTSPTVTVRSARRVFENPHPTLPDIYPSDHFGLYAELTTSS
jgi:endonuclease/exonuclease/phosphatase family metal-dependent hydrolase